MKKIEEIRTENINALIEKHGGLNPLSELLGRSRSQIDQWAKNYRNIDGVPRFMGPKSARLVERALNLPEGWMDTDHSREPRSPSEDEYSLVPVLDVHAACGNGYFNDQTLVEGRFALPKVMLHNLGMPEGRGRIIHATGNSMSPTIQDGAVVLINLADRELKLGKVYAACSPHEGLVLKRLIYEYNEATGTSVWIMRSDNPDKNQYPDRRLPPDESTVIAGRAVWVGHKL